MTLDAQIAFRTTDEMKGFIEGVAKKRNQKVSQLLNEILLEYAERNKNNGEGGTGSDIQKLLEKLEQHEKMIMQLKEAQTAYAKK